MSKENLYRKLTPVLSPLASPYRLLMRLRRTAYKRKWQEQYSPQTPCVSIGNISWGGTGKTPLTSWLLGWALKNGIHPVVLSRGYKADPGTNPLVVTPETSPQKAGDEPLMLRMLHPHAQIVVCPKRSKAARFAEQHLQPDLLILDDGMQHLAVARHYDIVLLRPIDLEDEWDAVIPSGSWREGVSALENASAFGMKVDPRKLQNMLPLINKKLRSFAKPFFPFHIVPQGLIPLQAFMGQHPLNSLQADKTTLPSSYVLVSATADPTQVLETTTDFLGTSPMVHLIYDDHHSFTNEDISTMLSHKLPIICTEKDIVKLIAHSALLGNTPVFSLHTTIIFQHGIFTNQTFESWWEQCWTNLTLTRFP